MKWRFRDTGRQRTARSKMANFRRATCNECYLPQEHLVPNTSNFHRTAAVHRTLCTILGSPGVFCVGAGRAAAPTSHFYRSAAVGLFCTVLSTQVKKIKKAPRESAASRLTQSHLLVLVLAVTPLACEKLLLLLLRLPLLAVSHPYGLELIHGGVIAYSLQFRDIGRNKNSQSQLRHGRPEFLKPIVMYEPALRGKTSSYCCCTYHRRRDCDRTILPIL